MSRPLIKFTLLLLKYALVSCIIKLYAKNARRYYLMEEKKYKISRIEGEYAYLRDEESGEELFIAMALLPLGADIGSIILYKDFTFEMLS